MSQYDLTTPFYPKILEKAQRAILLRFLGWELKSHFLVACFSGGGQGHYDYDLHQINQEYGANVFRAGGQHYERETNSNVERPMDHINQDYLNSMENRGYYQQGGADLKQTQGLTHQGDIQGNSFGNMEPNLGNMEPNSGNMEAKEEQEGMMERSYGHHTHVYHDHMHNHTNEHDHEHKVTSSSSHRHHFHNIVIISIIIIIKMLSSVPGAAQA